MVGLRVFDVGALIVWLVWFFRLREDDDGEDGGPTTAAATCRARTRPAAPGGGLELPKPDADPWPARRRDHGGDRPAATPPARRVPRPAERPARVPR